MDPEANGSSRGAQSGVAYGWVDRREYPFRSRYLRVRGGRMHYVDEGRGPPILLVHGTPTWSFLFRHLIRALSATHRVVACDHIGFGLSDKPKDWSYRPADHATNVSALISALGLDGYTLIVHDFGGPIGMSSAIDRPDAVRAFVLFNTWMWSLAGTPAERIGRVMASPFGRLLYLRLNVSPRFIMKAAFGDRSKLTPQIHRQYLEPFPTPETRHGLWALARELLDSSEWYERLWSARGAISDKPMLLLWGMRDPAFKLDVLERWASAFPQARVERFAHAGHFVPEEDPEGALQRIHAFLDAPDSDGP